MPLWASCVKNDLAGGRRWVEYIWVSDIKFMFSVFFALHVFLNRATGCMQKKGLLKIRLAFNIFLSGSLRVACIFSYIMLPENCLCWGAVWPDLSLSHLQQTVCFHWQTHFSKCYSSLAAHTKNAAEPEPVVCLYRGVHHFLKNAFM